MPSSRSPGRSVTSKVLAILAAFEAGPAALPLTRIAESADVSLPTAQRLVAELVEWGALERDEHGRYSVGMRMWEVAQNAGRRLRETARPYLHDLFSLTGETAHLAVREGNEALYVDRVHGTKRVPRASRVGGRLPLHATAVGKVLLAHEEPWFRDAYITAGLPARTRWTHVNPERLAEELRAIRVSGFATTFEEVREGACSIAVPVLDGSGRPVAALGLVLLSSQSAQLQRHLPVLRGIAARIGQDVRPVARFSAGPPSSAAPSTAPARRSRSAPRPR